MKQIIVMRNDLGMRKGKMVAQGAHASLGAVLQNREDPRVEEWLRGAFTKVCVRADSLEQLLDVADRAQKAGMIVYIITDNGRTEFGGVPTVTACAIGPDTDKNLQPVTGDLKLL